MFVCNGVGVNQIVGWFRVEMLGVGGLIMDYVAVRFEADPLARSSAPARRLR
jgi:hypothetical protein